MDLGLSRTVSEIITNFQTRVFNAPAVGFPLQLGIGALGQKLE